MGSDDPTRPQLAVAKPALQGPFQSGSSPGSRDPSSLPARLKSRVALLGMLIPDNLVESAGGCTGGVDQ